MVRHSGFYKACFYKNIRIILGCVTIAFSNMAWGVDNYLQDIKVLPINPNTAEILLEFAHPVTQPKSFSTDAPPTVVVDFAGVKNQAPKITLPKSSSYEIVKNINLIETDNKTRMIMELKQLAAFTVGTEGNTVKVTLKIHEQAFKSETLNSDSLSAHYQIKGFDFRRGDNGEGRIIFNLSSAAAAVDFKEADGRISARFIGATVQDKLVKRYDVSDFATPVRLIDIIKDNGNIAMNIEVSGEYDKIAYQIDKQFIIEIKSITKEEQLALKALTGRYTGDKLSLNFQDIEVRSILQVIADFSGFNIITTDSVSGNVTLRLQNVPWDQALDIILQSKGLAKREAGNVMLVAPAAEIAAREKAELEGQKSAEDLGPLKSELIQINYARAEDLGAILKDTGNSLMTSRGNVTVDKRTNTLLVQDVIPKLTEIRSLLRKLDVPVRQVEISTQIVTADNTLESALGVRFGGGANLGIGHRRLGIGSAVDRARAIADYQNAAGQSRVPDSGAVISPGTYNGTGPTLNNTEGLFSDLGASKLSSDLSPAKVGLALAKLPNGTLLDLELQALEYESKTRTIARPKLVTMDQNKASIEQGFQIPYQQATSAGAGTSVAFVTAALKLEVTPQIIPDNKISLDLQISKDSPGTTGSPPSINTNRMQTKVLVDNGETIVLGGIFNSTDTKSVGKVPFFGDLPLIGGLFRNRYAQSKPSELIIFLTPKILQPLTTSTLTNSETE